MLLKKLLAFYIFFCCTSAVFSQTATVDSNSIINTVTDAVIKKTNEQQYNIDNGKSFVLSQEARKKETPVTSKTRLNIFRIKNVLD